MHNYVMYSTFLINFLSCFFLENIFLNDPELKDDLPISYMSHKELYEHSIRKAVRIAEKIREIRNSGDDSVETYK